MRQVSPQVCGSDIPFRTSLLEKGSRSYRALKAAISSMYLQGVSTHRIFNAEERAHAEAKLAEFVKTHEKSAPKLATWAKQNIPEGLTVFGFPEVSRLRMRTSNICETLDSQIKRRTRVVGLFPPTSPRCYAW